MMAAKILGRVTQRVICEDLENNTVNKTQRELPQNQAIPS